MEGNSRCSSTMLKARQLPRRILTRLETRDKVHRASQHAIVVECVNRPLFRLVRNFLAPESVDTGQECCNAPKLFIARSFHFPLGYTWDWRDCDGSTNQPRSNRIFEKFILRSRRHVVYFDLIDRLITTFCIDNLSDVRY